MEDFERAERWMIVWELIWWTFLVGAIGFLTWHTGPGFLLFWAGAALMVWVYWLLSGLVFRLREWKRRPR